MFNCVLCEDVDISSIVSYMLYPFRMKCSFLVRCLVPRSRVRMEMSFIRSALVVELNTLPSTSRGVKQRSQEEWRVYRHHRMILFLRCDIQSRSRSLSYRLSLSNIFSFSSLLLLLLPFPCLLTVGVLF